MMNMHAYKYLTSNVSFGMISGSNLSRDRSAGLHRTGRYPNDTIKTNVKDRLTISKASNDGLSYKEAGVDIDAGNELVKRIQKLNPSIGGFSGLVPFGRLHNITNSFKQFHIIKVKNDI